MIRLLIFTLIGFCAFSHDADAQTTIVTTSPCKYAIVHQTEDDVSYTGPEEGIAPANLYSDPFDVYETIQIPLTVDMGQYIGINTPEGLELDSQIGQIEVDVENGIMRYNGQDITSQINAYCDQVNNDSNETNNDSTTSKQTTDAKKE
jgi:hypothetical protein